MAIAAAEIGLGLAIVLLVYRTHRHIDIDELRELADRDQPSSPEISAPESPSTQPARVPRVGVLDETGKP